MGGGYLELTATSYEDAYFINNPEITFFKSVYRRYSNFSIETIKNTFVTSLNLSHSSPSTSECLISRSGDLLKNIHVVFDIPSVQCKTIGDTHYQIKWVKNLGSVLIKEIDFMIEAQIIERLRSNWLYLYHNMYSSKEELEIFNKMTGNISELNNPKSYTNKQNYIIPGTKLTIPLPFWFTKSSGLTFPLIALTKNRVHLKITCNALKNAFLISSDNGVTWTKPPSHITLEQFTLKNVVDFDPHLMCEYVFIDDEERYRIMHNELVYTIQTTQYIDVVELQQNIQHISLPIKHPIKELIWVAAKNSRINRNDWFNFSNFQNDELTELELINTSNINDIASIKDEHTKHIIKKSQIFLNKKPRINEQNYKYFTLMQPQMYLKKNIPYGVHLFSFGLEPLNMNQPSGSCNASAFTYLDLHVDSKVIENDYYSMYIFAITYNRLRIQGGFGGLQFV